MSNEALNKEVDNAYREAAQKLLAAELIEEAAVEQVAEVLATTLAIEEAAIEEAEEVVALSEAVEEAAIQEAAEVVAEAELVEEEAMEEAAEAVEVAKLIEAAAAQEVVETLISAEIIEEAAAQEAANALVDAEIVKEYAAEEAVDALISANIIEEAAAQDSVKALQAAKKDEIEALYVQTARSVAYEDGVLTLNSLAANTLWFSDRPDRVVGHVTSQEFVDGWGEGEDSFADNPPNATLSILSEDDITDVVVVLTNPALEGDTLSYDVEVLDGEMPEDGGPSSLFIDVIGRPLSPVSIAGVHRRTRRRGRRRGRRRARRRF